MRLSRPHYESDITKFLAELKAQDPQLESRQVQGRLRLWDRPAVKLDEMQRAQKAKVPQKAYVYQPQ
jgi:hypothetical protein